MKHLLYYRPHPKDGEGNVFSLSTPWGVGVRSKVNPAGGSQVKGKSSRGGQVKGKSSWGVRSGQRSIQPGGVRSKVNPAGGVRSSPGGGVGCQVQPGGVQVKGQSSQGGSGPASWGGVRSSQRGGQVQPAERGSGPAGQGGGQVQPAGGSASCALLRAVCLLRSRRRTFLFVMQSNFLQKRQS